MPTWGEILVELQATAKTLGPNPTISPFDTVRRKYLDLLHQHTQRNIILYASNWTQPGVPIADANMLMVNEEDIQGLMEVIHGLGDSGVDLILHSPGGSAEAAEAFVSYLRTKFSDVRVIVPQAAMSAATMIACAANKVVMGKHSFLGPIDPQVRWKTDAGSQMIAVQAILDQFEQGKEECKEDPKNLGPWLPILSQYGPALLVQSQEAMDLSKELVSEWLTRYMFSGWSPEEARERARKVAHFLSNHKYFKTHGRHISRTDVRGQGLVVDDLETDQVFQDLVLSVFHATTHTFGATTAVKIVENHLGKAFIKQQRLPPAILLGPGGAPLKLQPVLQPAPAPKEGEQQPGQPVSPSS